MSQPAAKPASPSVKTAITPTRADNYPEWYQQVIRGADMAEMSGVRGCMVIKPWGYGLWELLARDLDQRFKDTGHENAYFPLFIPLSLIEKEADHVAGFAKEMAVVTHHRVVQGEDGKLHPAGELEEPLIVRPTSETIIGEAFARWVKSYRDLPLLINQWANVVRWEMRPRIFLRTAEFLWQEGHTAHASEAEARAEVMTMLKVYQDVAEQVLALPVIAGEKTPGERFPGAVDTFCIEAMMQDGKALQAGTSHYLGQNFAEAAGIRFQNKDGAIETAYTTSWGVSTRLIGAVIMTHADDNGLRLPPAVAPQQVVIVPILREGADNEQVLAFCNEVVQQARTQSYQGSRIRIKLDDRDLPSADKRWQWIKKGVPLIVEIGPKDVEKGSVALTRRVDLEAKKEFIPLADFTAQLPAMLQASHDALYQAALAIRQQRLRTDITTLEQFKAYFGESGDESYTKGQGFVQAWWNGDEEAAEPLLKAMGLTIRCIPFDQPKGQTGPCVLTGQQANKQVIFARAY
jgi:prolyl-tRNA synthetase